MATSSIQSANSVQSLAETLTKRFDTDGDGRLTTQEFTSVLTKALSSSSTASVPKTTGQTTSMSADGTPRTQINQILSGYPDTAAGLASALPHLLATIFGIRLDDTGTTASTAPGASSSSSATTSGTARTGANGIVVDPTPFTGVSANYPFEGFNFDREQNPGKSAKDAFAYLANQAPPPPFENKAALGEWFSTYIKPGMDELGHKVLAVSGDTFTCSNWQGTGVVDFVRGAALAWQTID